jgi:hypothetical protein
MATTDVFTQAFAKRVLDAIVSSANQSAVVPVSGGSPNLTVALSTTTYPVGTPIAFVSGTPPTSTPQVVNNTVYYILSNTGSIITIAPTQGGTAITFTTVGTSPVISPALGPTGPLYLALLNGTLPTTDNATLTEFTGYTDTNNSASSTTRPAINFGLVTPTGGVATQSIATTNAPTYAITGSDTVVGIAITNAQLKATSLTTTSGTGNVIWYGSMTVASIAVVNTDTLTFNTGQVTLSLG